MLVCVDLLSQSVRTYHVLSWFFVLCGCPALAVSDIVNLKGYWLFDFMRFLEVSATSVTNSRHLAVTVRYTQDSMQALFLLLTAGEHTGARPSCHYVGQS